MQGELEGAKPASNGIECPEGLAEQGQGEQSEDFCGEKRRESNGIFMPAVMVYPKRQACTIK